MPNISLEDGDLMFTGDRGDLYLSDGNLTSEGNYWIIQTTINKATLPDAVSTFLEVKRGSSQFTITVLSETQGWALCNLVFKPTNFNEKYS